MLVTKEPLIQTMACVNWPDTYPDRPEVEFDVRCTGEELLLAFRVREEFTRAVCAADRENIWEDSCVEFFFAPDADGLYYNFECSCIGKLLLCCGRGRENRVSLPEEAYSAVRRRGSLGDRPFGIRQIPEWELELAFRRGRWRSATSEASAACMRAGISTNAETCCRAGTI